MTQVPLVVDIFHGDRVNSFVDAHAAGLRGVIHKATTGADGRDDAYRRRRPEAKAAGLLWGLFSGRRDVRVFFLACVIVAGVFGAVTVHKKILFVQELPGIIALALVLQA